VNDQVSNVRLLNSHLLASANAAIAAFKILMWSSAVSSPAERGYSIAVNGSSVLLRQSPCLM
jgi:hypothetical protein